MKWLTSLLSRVRWYRKPVEVPNRLLVTELKPPFPQKDVPGIARRVFLVRATDPDRPIQPLAREDGIPKLNDEHPEPYPKGNDGKRLLAKRLRVDPAEVRGAYYVVVDYAYQFPPIPARPDAPKENH